MMENTSSYLIQAPVLTFNEIWPSFDETNASTMSSKLDQTFAMITFLPISPVYILRMINIKIDDIYIYLPSMCNDKVSLLSLPISFIQHNKPV